MRAHRSLARFLSLLLGLSLAPGVLAQAPVVSAAAAPEFDWRALHDEAEVDFKAGRFPAAGEKLERALAGALVSGDAQAISDVHYALGAVLLEQRKLDEARVHLRASLEHEEKVNGENATTTLEALESLAIADDYAGDYVEAEVHFRSLLKRWIALEGPKGPSVGRALTNLAVNLGYQEKDAETEALYRKALAIYLETEDPEQEAFVRTGLGNLCSRAGKTRCARKEYLAALRLREKTLGPDHPYIATVLFNLSGIELDENKPLRAHALLERCLKIRRVTLPPDHPFLIDAEARMKETEEILAKRRKIRKKKAR